MIIKKCITKIPTVDESISELDDFDFGEEVLLSEISTLFNTAMGLYKLYPDIEFISEGFSDFINSAIETMKEMYDKFVIKVKEILSKMMYTITRKNKAIDSIAKTIEYYDASIVIPYRPYSPIEIFNTYPDMSNISTIAMSYIDRISELTNDSNIIKSWADDLSKHISPIALDVYRGRTIGKTYNISSTDYKKECLNVFIDPAYSDNGQFKRATIDKSNIKEIVERYNKFPDILKKTKHDFSTMSSLIKTYIRDVEKHNAFKNISTSNDGAYYTINKKNFNIENGKIIFNSLKAVISDLSSKLSIVTTCYKIKISTLSADIDQSAHIINAYYDAGK